MKYIATLTLALFTVLTLQAQTFKEREVELKVKGGSLNGTLLIPKKANGTAVVFISGSGPTDRDGNSGLEGQNNSLKMLAEEFSENGYITLRVDKRAIGKSMPGFPEKDLRIETYVDDIVEWAAWLKKERTEVTKVVFAGHSEGSLIGMLAAQKWPAAGFISLAGTGFSGDSILKAQLIDKVPGPLYEQSVVCLDSLKAGHLVKNPPKALMMLFRPDVQPYIMSWIKYNPAQEIAKLNCPMLIIQGLNDIQVSVDNADALFNGAGKGKSPAITKKEIVGMTHTLKFAGPTYEENLKTYTDPALPLMRDVVNDCMDFLSGLNF